MQNIKYDVMDRDTKLGTISVIITIMALYISVWLFH